MTYPYSFTVKIYEHDHFDKSFEDRKNNLYIVDLLPEIEEWIKKNTSGDYELNCEDLFMGYEEFILLCFNTNVEACMFRMALCKDPLSFYRPKLYRMYCKQSKSNWSSDWEETTIYGWLIENIGEEGLTWIRHFRHVSFYKEEDAVLFKIRWH